MMTVASFLLLILYYYSIKSGNQKEQFLSFVAITAVVDILNIQGYFIRLGEFSLKYSAVTNTALFLYIIVFVFREKIKFNRSVLYAGLFFLICALVSVLYELIDPYAGLILNSFSDNSLGGWDEYMRGGIGKEHVNVSLGMTFRAYVKLSMYTLIVMIIKSTCDYKDLKFILMKMCKLLTPYIFVGPIELIIKNVLSMPELPYEITKVIFGIVEGETTYSEPILRGDLYALQGFAEEPSRFIVSLFIISLLLMVNFYTDAKKNVKINIFYQFVIFFTFMLSGGLTSVWCVFILFIIAFDLKFKIYEVSAFKIIIVVMAIFAVSCGAIYIVSEYLTDDNYIQWRISMAIQTFDFIISGSVFSLDNDLDSSLPRFVSIVDTFMDFLNRPFWGLGLMLESAHGSTVNMLADYGIIGTIAWMKFMLVGKENVSYDFFYFVIIGIVSGIAIVISRTFATQFFCFLLLEITSLYTCNGWMVKVKHDYEKF